MSDLTWVCVACDRQFSKLDVAWGWATMPHCGDCWETIVGKTLSSAHPGACRGNPALARSRPITVVPLTPHPLER
jgi:hypothetical protein